MSEISMYEAQKKKMQGLCDEHDLTFRFLKDRYPIVFIIKPVQGLGAQMSMLENAEENGFISPEASMTWIFQDGVLTTKVTGGTFTISKVLRTKIENILLKMITYWQQYFFRDIIERKAVAEGNMPVIDESEDDGPVLPEGAEPLEEYDDEDTEPEDTEDDTDLPDAELPDDDSDADTEDSADPTEGFTDEEIKQATSIIRMENKASVALLQRRMGFGYAKAAKMIDLLEELGVVGAYNGPGTREVLPFDEPDEEVADNE